MTSIKRTPYKGGLRTVVVFWASREVPNDNDEINPIVIKAARLYFLIVPLNQLTSSESARIEQKSGSKKNQKDLLEK